MKRGSTAAVSCTDPRAGLLLPAALKEQPRPELHELLPSWRGQRDLQRGWLALSKISKAITALCCAIFPF